MQNVLRALRAQAKLVAACGALLVLAGVAAFFLAAHSAPAHAAYSDADPAYNRAYWAQEVAAHGPRAAYQEFAQRNAKAPAGRQHFSAHVIGSVLGDEFGPAGIAYCDAAFGFGCYHGFFAEVISAGGTALIPKLDAACTKAYGPGGTGCQHGIGHGILEYVGYGKLDQALALCDTTTQFSPLLGCASGVFMENDFRLAGTGTAQGPSRRDFDPAHPYAPCTEVAAQYQPACYVELGQWLRISLGPSYAKLGALCAAAPGTAARTDCFMGVGSIQDALEGYDPATALAHCAQYAGRDQLSCRAGAWWGFYQVPEERAKDASICAYADAAQEQACLALGDFTGGKASAAGEPASQVPGA